MTLPPTDLTLERFKRQVALAQARGEPVGPLVKRLVVETVEELQRALRVRDHGFTERD